MKHKQYVSLGAILIIGGVLFYFIYPKEKVLQTADELRSEILSGQLKINLPDQLRQDNKCSEELIELLNECKRQAMDDASNESLTSEEHAKHSYEIVSRMAQFTNAHPDAASSLTAKLVAAEELRHCESDFIDDQLVLNTRKLLNEIIDQHPRTWQASVAYLKLSTLVFRKDLAEYHKERMRLLEDILKKDLVELPTNDPEFDACIGWAIYNGPPFKATILSAIGTCQYNLGTLDVYDVNLLNEAKQTKQEVIDKYPQTKLGKQAVDTVRTINGILERIKTFKK